MSIGSYAKFLIEGLLSQHTDKDDSKTLEELLTEAKQHYDLVLPRKADSDTRVDSVQIQRKTLIFHNTLFNGEKSEMDEDIFTDVLTDVLQAELLRNKRLRRIFDKNGTIIYIYVDKHGEVITKIELQNKLQG